ncbi:basic-leucine zipper transcription factor A-like [Chenopodium quinoa]|uniref:basic-leucine zipper transcription factor A-like n=1 Tax=Chenopodium quinoa TaxID=63459 RepID=UPI000B7790B2|nr:basic-leucine zipper transcription factor A-like [Chenopodium quinoa]
MAENAALADAIRLLAENVIQNQGDQVDPQAEMFKKLAQVRPLVFRGGADPTVLENWIREFDKLFVALNCPEGMKVDQAAMYLKDEADIWWRDNAVTVRAKPNFGCEVFKTSLRDKFYPPFLKKQKAQEFISLAMGDMSISEGNQNVSSSSNANNGERTYHCKKCRRNHPRRDCDGNLVTCRFSNKRGHREYECYTKQKQQGNGGNGGNTQQRPNNFNNQGNRGNGQNGKFGNGSNNNTRSGNGNSNNSGNNNSGNNNNGYQARNNTPTACL